MSPPPAFAGAAQIEASLERLAEACPDPTPHVYARLFAEHPQMRPLFWRDATGAIQGEMLAKAFEAILDFAGERRYAHHLIATEQVTHAGYDVPPEVFGAFFRIVRDVARDLVGDEWTGDTDAAWDGLLAELDRYLAAPR